MSWTIVFVPPWSAFLENLLQPTLLLHLHSLFSKKQTMPNKPDYSGSYYGHNSQGNGYRTEYTSSRGGVSSKKTVYDPLLIVERLTKNLSSSFPVILHTGGVI